MKLRALALLGVCVISITAAGCGDSAGSSTASANSAAPASQTKSLAGHKLVGAWEGAIEIDEQKVIQSLQDKNVGFDPEEAIAILNSIAMAIDFHDDGTMRLAGTMNTPNGPEESSGQGRWELVSENGKQVTIRSIEEGREGQEIELIFVDQDTFTMAPPPPNPNVGLMRFHRVAHVAHADGAASR